ncbi:MAG: hypothetical protein KAW45_09585 [Thermoplasmatales archaeon]|nr:hypothetical protein [Thermoplasmatales archaeon]
MKHDTKKKQKSWLRNLFHPKASPIKEDTWINLSTLKKLATTKEQKDILKLIEQETIPSVRAAWIDYFLEKTKHSKYKGDFYALEVSKVSGAASSFFYPQITFRYSRFMLLLSLNKYSCFS